MALVAEIKINRELIAVVCAVRVSNVDAGNDPELVSDYRVEVWHPTEGFEDFRDDPPIHQVALPGTVQHRYGDGALALMRKAMELLEEDGVE